MDMYDLMKEVIKKQVHTYQDGHVRSFMDIYIKEIKVSEVKGKKSGFLCKKSSSRLIFVLLSLVYSFPDDQMMMICNDFLFPSLSAMETQISFLFKHLVYRTDIVEKIQRELDNIVGFGRLPELDDRIQ